jgi:hypothetical protein
MYDMYWSMMHFEYDDWDDEPFIIDDERFKTYNLPERMELLAEKITN